MRFSDVGIAYFNAVIAASYIEDPIIKSQVMSELSSTMTLLRKPPRVVTDSEIIPQSRMKSGHIERLMEDAIKGVEEEHHVDRRV